MSRALLFAAAITFAGPAFAETAYFAGIDDLPLPAGFEEVISAPAFRGDDGQIVFGAAEGSASAAQVRAFYDASLPPLGWAFSPGGEDALIFQRGRETLSVSIREGAQRTRLSVQLVTRQSAAFAE